MSGDIAGFHNARRDADRAHGAVEHPIPGFARKVPLPPPSTSPPPSPPPASGVQPFTDVDARRERELQEALGKIAELEKQVKQLTMLERMASQHATRCDANVAEADHRLALANAEIARLNAAERKLYADLLDEKVTLECQRQAVLDLCRIRQAEDANGGWTDVDSVWPSEIRDLLEEQK